MRFGENVGKCNGSTRWSLVIIWKEWQLIGFLWFIVRKMNFRKYFLGRAKSRLFNTKFHSTFWIQFNIHSIATQHIPTLLPQIPTHNYHPQTIMSTLKQEDSHNIRHISDFHFPLTYKGISYASCCLYMYRRWFIPSTNKIFVSKKEEDILSLRKI